MRQKESGPEYKLQQEDSCVCHLMEDGLVVKWPDASGSRLRYEEEAAVARGTDAKMRNGCADDVVSADGVDAIWMKILKNGQVRQRRRRMLSNRFETRMIQRQHSYPPYLPLDDLKVIMNQMILLLQNCHLFW